LGAELRTVRDSAGLTLKQVAARLGRDHTTVSRWERGLTKPSIQDASAFLAIMDVIGEERDRILELAQHDGLTDWVGNNTLLMVREYERTASTITEVNPQLIPGLLQTRAYARSIMLAGGATQDAAERGAAARCDRQDVLTRRSPVEFVAFIGASALLYPPCSDDIMSEQCHGLLVMSARPNISIRIVPQRKGLYNPMVEGSFYLLELPHGRPVVQLDHFAGASVITTRKKVDRFRTVIAMVDRIALSESESVWFIKEQRRTSEHDMAQEQPQR
jgi:transcriptional regulator with XRE-family HTH domain